MILARAQHKLSLDGKVIQAGRFDHKSTNEEREALLRAILETEAASVTEEDKKAESAILDDDELNEILARGEEEFHIFRAMDQKMDSTKPRLITREELPEIFLNMDDSLNESEDNLLPERRRSQWQSSYAYDDQLTDGQWLRKLDDEKEYVDSKDDPLDDDLNQEERYNNDSNSTDDEVENLRDTKRPCL